MRAAVLLAELAAQGRPVDRAGSGVVVEVNPAASLHRWGLPHQQYKGDRHRPQRDVVAAVVDAALAPLQARLLDLPHIARAWRPPLICPPGGPRASPGGARTWCAFRAVYTTQRG